METSIRGLESLGDFGDNYGNILVPILLDKLPATTRQHLAREHGHGSWTLSELRKSINREIEVLEAGQTTNELSTDAFVPTVSFFAGAKQKDGMTGNQQYNNSAGQRFCVFCNESHNGECKKVRDVKDRMTIVKFKRLCFNCLNSSHQVSNCISRFRCRRCKGKHHTSICVREVTTSQTQAQVSNYQSRGADDQNVENRNTVIFHTSTATDVLLKTATAKIASEYDQIETGILMDEGAQRSFISQKLANRLHLKSDGTDLIQLSAFGDPSQTTQRLNTATIYLLADDGKTIPIRVLIVPTIANQINNRHRQSLKDVTHLKGLELAHPVSMDDSFEISVLIGADYYWQIVGDEIIRGNGPTAVSSKIGYLLSGPMPVNTGNSLSVNVMDVIINSAYDTTELSQFWNIESVRAYSDNCRGDSRQGRDTCVSYTDIIYIPTFSRKQDESKLPTNYRIAKKQRESIVRRQKREPALLAKYDNITKDQRQRKFTERKPVKSSTENKIHISTSPWREKGHGYNSYQTVQ